MHICPNCAYAVIAGMVGGGLWFLWDKVYRCSSAVVRFVFRMKGDQSHEDS
jgi:hypothetical protein